ncbi:MAG: cob(I)yrinic acid a,c-diamide adenosyltransferase [Rikenellaceae bacterium]
MKVYTKQGDSGTTSLVGGERVTKWDSRVEAYGTVDELAAFVALLADKMRTDEGLKPFVAELDSFGSVLMSLEAHLAAGERCEYKLPTLSDKPILTMERSIDSMQEKLPAITKFTIPGGCETASMCNVCRTICRRAERRVAEVCSIFAIDPLVGATLNRFSDYLYLLGRTTAAHYNAEEILWIP